MAFQIGTFIEENKVLSPLPESRLSGSMQKGLAVYNDSLAPYYSSYLKDFTTVSDWFPKVPQSLSRQSEIKQYQINVPKLGLTNLIVKVGGADLSKSLVQYGNQILPGEKGNSVILGHSTLPQLFKQNDYRTIFTYLPTLETGDRVTVNINGFTYNYLVYDMFVVNPEETWVLEEKAEDSILTLITCVPPGTYWKRLVVRTRLEGI